MIYYLKQYIEYIFIINKASASDISITIVMLYTTYILDLLGYDAYSITHVVTYQSHVHFNLFLFVSGMSGLYVALLVLFYYL